MEYVVELIVCCDVVFVVLSVFNTQLNCSESIETNCGTGSVTEDWTWKFRDSSFGAVQCICPPDDCSLLNAKQNFRDMLSAIKANQSDMCE